jgi:hypothetical protein
MKAAKFQNLQLGKTDLKTLVSYDYTVEQFSDYHFRINGPLDVWPSSRRYYDQKTQRKGEYNSLEFFVREFLPC